MACISKLASAIAYDCDSGATGLVSAIIINKADIASFTVSSSGGVITDLTLVAGAKAYKIDTVKRSLVLSSALKVNEGAPNAYSHSASLVLTTVAGTNFRTSMAAFSNGSFVIFASMSAGSIPAYGLYYGLSAVSAEHSSHDNGGWYTVTLETPENVIGEDTLTLNSALYQTLYDAAVG